MIITSANEVMFYPALLNNVKKRDRNFKKLKNVYKVKVHEHFVNLMDAQPLTVLEPKLTHNT